MPRPQHYEVIPHEDVFGHLDTTAYLLLLPRADGAAIILFTQTLKMSEPIPESIPTSADPRSRRPVKRARGANSAVATQANEIESLFLDPDRPISLPPRSAAAKPSLPPPPEIVANVQGSSAGAGSGEFHVYKASRRREYERLRAMDEEAKKEEDDEKWEREEREKKLKDEEKTRKNREKRNKRKAKKGGSGWGGGGSAGGDLGKENVSQRLETHEGEDDRSKLNGVKKPLQVPHQESRHESGGDDYGVAEIVQEKGIVIHEDD